MRNFLSLEAPLVPTQHPNVLVETAKAQGASLPDLLQGTSIHPAMLTQPAARISYLHFGVLVANALRLTGNPALGIDFGKRIHVSNLGIMGLLVLSSETAGQALLSGLHYAPLVAPGWELSVATHGGTCTYHAEPLIDFGPFLPFAAESLLTAVTQLSRFVLGESTPIRAVRLSYPAPPYADRYSLMSTAPFHFDEPCIEADFDAAVLARPLPGADPITRALARRQCAADLAAMPARESLVRCVRGILALRPGQYANLEAVARALHTTPRTLRRGLERLRTSYQAILDDVRREHALSCLTTSRVALDVAAAQLGFSDVRALRRAVRRWTGKSPVELRSGVICSAPTVPPGTAS